MTPRRLARALLFPHIAVLILLLPSAAFLLVYSMLTLGETHPLRIAAYVLAFYTLTLWCCRAPRLIRFFKSIKSNNRYVRAWLTNPRLRMNVTVTCHVLWNCAYAGLQLGMGIYHRSAWFYSLADYYACLAVMRFFLVRHTLRHKPGERLRTELTYYRACGLLFLLMNLALSGMMLYMLRENRTTLHHEITTIAMAAYTFTTLTMAIINVIKYRKYKSPVLSASKAISLAAACVSLLTLENTMLTTFSKDSLSPLARQLFLGLSGGAISIFIIIMAVYMIAQSNKRIKGLER